MATFEIIKTGSKGNAVVVDGRILIDCGAPYRDLKPFARKLQVIMLTHVHVDHFCRSTIRALASDRPALRFVCAEWLVIPLLECGVSKYSIDIVDTNETVNLFFGRSGVSAFTVKAFRLRHNAPNCGYKLWIDDWRMIYATDTNSLSHVEAKAYDLYLIEANYSEEDIVRRICVKQEIGAYSYEWEVLNNHLSREKADDWLYSNMGPNSRYVYMHEHSGAVAEVVS